MMEQKFVVMTREKLISIIGERYKLQLMEWQKVALWDFYQCAMRGEKYILVTPPRIGKAFMCRIMNNLWTLLDNERAK